jgi:hypothetical protein
MTLSLFIWTINDAVGIIIAAIFLVCVAIDKLIRYFKNK